MIEIRNLVKAHGNQSPVINGLNLDIDNGHSVSIQGASGSGKSTLLALIAGFTPPDSGSITIGATSLPFKTQKQGDLFRRTQLGVVFQSFNLLDCLTVWDNIAFTARLKGNYDHRFQTRIMHLMGIEPLAGKPTTQLSGGEQQRVAIARSLVHRPTLVLADEPTGNLDEKTSAQVAESLFAICQELNTTLVVVTHSQDVASRAMRSLLLHQGVLEPATR